MNYDALRHVIQAQAKVDALVAGRHEADAASDVVIKCAAGKSRHFYSGTDSIAVTAVANRVDPEPMVAVARRIHENARTFAKGCNYKIRKAIIIKVGYGGAALKALAEKVLTQRA